MTSTHDSGHERITHDIALHCVDQHDRPLVFMASFAYEAALPYAVAITCHLTEADLTWTIDRALVEAGLIQRVGVGSVSVAPVIAPEGEPAIELQFHSASGRLVTTATPDDLRRFLADTWRIVPPGTESNHLDLDALVVDLLES